MQVYRVSRPFSATLVRDGIVYEMVLSVDSLRFVNGEASKSLTFRADAYRREGAGSRKAYSCYFAAYKRTGTSYVRAATGSKSTYWNRTSAISVASSVDAVVIFMSDTAMTAASLASAAPSSYLAMAEIRMLKTDYRLLPSRTEIPFAVDSGTNDFTPPSRDINCGYTKSDENGTRSFPGSDPANTTKETGSGYNGTAPYNIFYRFQASGGSYGGWQWLRDAGSKTAVITISSTTTDIAIEFALSSSGSYSSVSDANIIDRKTVPIVKSGKQGPNGGPGPQGPATPIYDFSFQNYSAVFDVQTMKLTGYVKLGINRHAGDSVSYYSEVTPQISLDGGSTWSNMSAVAATPFFEKDYSSGTVLAAIPQALNFRVTVGSATYTSAMPVSIRGLQGELGPLCYDAGDYSDQIVYTSSETQTVSVDVPINGSDEAETWVLVAASNVVGGVHISPKDANQSVWRQGVNKNVVKTKYLFTNFGKLAESVMSGSWQFSANGKIDGATYNDGALYGSTNKPGYMFFDGTSVQGSRNLGLSASNFTNIGSSPLNLGYFTLSAGNRIIKVTGKVTGGTMTVMLYKGNTMVSNAAVAFNSTSLTSKNIVVQDVAAGQDYNLRAYVSSSSYKGTVTTAAVVTFAPNYAVDLLTGVSYSKRSYIEGEVHATSGSFRGPVSVTGGGEVYVAGNGNGKSSIRIKDGKICFYGIFGFPNIELGTDGDGCAVLRFYDKNGNFKYDLGPGGIVDAVSDQDSYFLSALMMAEFDITQTYTDARMMSLVGLSVTEYFKFYEGYTRVGDYITYRISGTSSPSVDDGMIFPSDTLDQDGTPSSSAKTTGIFVGNEVFYRYDSQNRPVYYRKVYQIVGKTIKEYLASDRPQVFFYRKNSPDTCLTNSDGTALSLNFSNAMSTYMKPLG